ncbi:hypothetical protein [Massilia cavernae]|uniref:hypothetical protein n=1 Tax=Massilia cavernae TaxID=2320864 RepID=UPI00351D2219
MVAGTAIADRIPEAAPGFLPRRAESAGAAPGFRATVERGRRSGSAKTFLEAGFVDGLSEVDRPSRTAGSQEKQPALAKTKLNTQAGRRERMDFALVMRARWLRALRVWGKQRHSREPAASRRQADASAMLARPEQVSCP